MIRGALNRFRKGLSKTRDGFVGRMQSLFGRHIKLDSETLDQIEELLISADMGVKSSLAITRNIEKRLQEEGGEATIESVLQVVRRDVRDILVNAKPKAGLADRSSAGGSGGKKKKKKKKKGKSAGAEAQAATQAAETEGTASIDFAPKVIFIVGVNGTGKTTSIAKLANLLKNQGHSVLLAAGDTFRAAAVDQLKIWAERIDVECISQGPGADPAAVVFDALSAAQARKVDYVIVDTAGRLHTKTNLMDELGKIERIIEKKIGIPPETLLVVDANTGQNGLSQAAIFAETIPVEGLFLTKLDGTAKGGIVVAIAEGIGLPVKYVGMGEQVEDIAEFDPELFAEALFADWQESNDEQQ